MKKFWKVFLISLASLVGLVLLVIAVALWIVFTPARLTPIVNRQLPKFITCSASVERVELTFFSSFPRLELRVDGLSIVNPVDGAPRDTLLGVAQLRATVDVKAFLKRKELLLSDLLLSDGVAAVHIDSLGRGNFDVLRTSEPEPASGSEAAATTGPEAPTPATAESAEEEFPIAHISLDELRFEDMDVYYLDRTSRMEAALAGFSGRVRATVEVSGAIAADVSLEPFDLDLRMGPADSLASARIEGLDLDLAGTIDGNDARLSGFSIAASSADLTYAGVDYLKDGAVSLSAVVDADMAQRSARIHSATLSLGSLKLSLDGSVRADSLRGLETDLHYELSKWSVDELVALVPPPMAHYLDRISVAGTVSSEGTVKGFYSADAMPVVDAKLDLEDGRVEYPAVLPWPLSGVAAGLAIRTDLSDEASDVTIEHFSARTARSVLKARGRADRLFSDPHVDITADVDVDLSDVRPFIPDTLPFRAAGNVSGCVKADLRISQLEKMQFDRMKLSGSLLATGLDAHYDTIAVRTPSAGLEFALPNPYPSTRNTTFAAASLTSDHLTAQMYSPSLSDPAASGPNNSGPNNSGLNNSGPTANANVAAVPTVLTLDGMRVALETSNVLDTLSVPAVVVNFAFISVEASAPGMSAHIIGPNGKASMEPGRRGITQRMGVVLNSGRLSADAGDMKAVLDRMNIDANIDYNDSREDLWQKLSPRGSVDVSGLDVSVPSLNYPVRVPTLVMDFTPRQFRIEQARAILDESDFSLSGTVDSILPYFRGTGELKAEFNFSSPVTNVSQLLALTSGIGDEELQAEKATAETAVEADEFTGPYMVPKGIDVMLHAGIDTVLWEGAPLFSNIRGDVQVKDGVVFISPQLSFDSPATHGEVQLMYRTPDKNNLFAGVSLHLERIEMQELIGMVPDLDKLVPQLRSFGGQAEFHAAAEGYMDSTYRFKMSTLRGAGSIGATNLTLKDDEIFRKIAFLLKYKEEGTIRVDSLRAEFTVFRNTIDVYPFLFRVDRYGAVISGRHNLDMNFDYNISLVESPLPFRVAVDVVGKPDDLQFKVFSKSRYPDFYRPAYNGVAENRQMELRDIIRDALLEGREE